MADDKRHWDKPLPISQLEPGFLIINWDKVKTPEQYSALDQIWDKRKPGESVHHHEDQPSVDGYAKGGRVQKYGSDTVVSCKTKHS